LDHAAPALVGEGGCIAQGALDARRVASVGGAPQGARELAPPRAAGALGVAVLLQADPRPRSRGR